MCTPGARLATLTPAAFLLSAINDAFYKQNGAFCYYRHRLLRYASPNKQQTMKAQTDHFRVSGVRSALPADFPEISLRLKLLSICAVSAFAFGLNSPVQALEPGKIWVASWTASPQGPYPAGWAVAQPDLSFALPRGDTDGATDQTFRLIVKPDL